MKYSMSSSYRIDTEVSRKWDEDFSLYRTPRQMSTGPQADSLERKTSPLSSALLDQFI